jgi:cytochrome c5
MSRFSLRRDPEFDSDYDELRAEAAAERRATRALYHWCDECHGHTGPGSPCYAGGDEDEPQQADDEEDDEQLQAMAAADRRCPGPRLRHWCGVCHGRPGPGSPCYGGAPARANDAVLQPELPAHALQPISITTTRS